MHKHPSPLVLRLLLSVGLKWMVGIGHTSCMGLASTRHPALLSHPAPSRNSPLIHTPSCKETSLLKELPLYHCHTLIYGRIPDDYTASGCVGHHWHSSIQHTYFSLYVAVHSLGMYIIAYIGMRLCMHTNIASMM